MPEAARKISLLSTRRPRSKPPCRRWIQTVLDSDSKNPRSEDSYSLRNLICQCDPSQNGLFFEPPQRQRVHCSVDAPCGSSSPSRSRRPVTM